MKIVLGKILALTRAIRLRPEQAGEPSWVQFIAGQKSPNRFSGGIGLTWWADKDTATILEAVGTLVIAGGSEFNNCDLATAVESAVDTLQELCLDNDIFIADDVFAMRQSTLFDCRRMKAPEFSAALLLAIEGNLRRRITKHCTVYVLPRFITKSFSLIDGSLHVVAKDDSAAWGELANKGYVFDGWSPSRPKLNGRDDLIFSPQGRVDCVLAAEESGTQKGVHFNSIIRFRQLIAVLYAIVSNRSRYPIHKSIADPPEFCIQFTHRDSSQRVLTRQDCQPLVPVYAEDVVVDAGDQARVAEWYSALANADKEVRGRAEKGAHFFNRGMNSDDIEAFINYFITLDAIFGERGSVETSILKGVRELGLGKIDSERTRWLFELRSELVHGGSRYIAEWPKHVRYRSHFRSEPAHDVQRIARIALLRSPDVLGNERTSRDRRDWHWRFLRNIAKSVSRSWRLNA